jgi:hypothetical protein
MRPTKRVGLDETKSAAAAGDGTAVIEMGPIRAGQIWYVTNEAVSCTPPAEVVNPSEPTCTLYLGRRGGTELTSSYTGSKNSASIEQTLEPFQFITAVWEQAEPGSICRLSLTGTMRVPA